MNSPAVAASALRAIGNTPLVRLNRVVPGDCAEIVVKLEAFNPTGSRAPSAAVSCAQG